MPHHLQHASAFVCSATLALATWGGAAHAQKKKQPEAPKLTSTVFLSGTCHKLEPGSTVNSFVHSRLLLRLCLGLLLLAGAPSVVEAQGDPAKAKREFDKSRTETFKQELDAMIAAAILAGPMHDCVEENIKRYTLVIPGQFEVIVAVAYGACRTIVFSYLENQRINADLKNQRTERDRPGKGRVSPPTLQSLLQENRPRWLHLAIELELARQQRNAPTSQ